MVDWDVFVSYTHADQVAAARIQAFVEDYPLPAGRRRLRVFRDKTDLTAGELGRSIPAEIGRARVLMLCCSPAAARSGWVTREVAAFHAAHGEAAPLVPLLLGGEPEAVVPENLRGREALILDLRAGWRFGRPRANTRVELLRAVAAAADVPLRELIPWDAARRRRRQAIVGTGVAVAVAAIAATSTSAWLTRREAAAQALRRDAETAVVRIEAGEVAEGVAALGHTLARDVRGLLTAERDVFRYWLDMLPPAGESARRHRGLLRINGRIHLPDPAGRLLPMDLAEPFAASSPWPSRIVAVGNGGLDLVNAATGAVDTRIALPPGTRIVGQHLSSDGRAFTVLARMTRIENDEDNPNLPIPCSALLLRADAVARAAAEPAVLPLGIVTTEGTAARPMQRVAGGDLFWHDCVAESGGDATASRAAAPAPTAQTALAVPRLPEGNDIVVPDFGTWDDAMRGAWPAAAVLPVANLPAVLPEAARWREAGTPVPAFPLRLGLGVGLDAAAIDALGFDAVEGGNGLYGEVVELAAFDGPGGRIYWGISVCGNSYVCASRCTGPPGGKVTACVTGAQMVTLEAWQVFAPDARRFAHLSRHMGEPPVAVFDIASLALRAPDRPPPAQVVNAVFTAENARLVVLTEADQLLVYSLAEDGTPREERRFGLGRAGAETGCAGGDRMVALTGAAIAVVTRDCTLHRVDAASGARVWQTRIDVPGAGEAAVQVGATAGDGPLMALAGGRVRLFHTATGAALSRPLDVSALPGVAPDAVSRASLPRNERPAAPTVDVGERRYSRALPPDRAAALALLPVLDRHTLVSRADGRTPLQRLPED